METQDNKQWEGVNGTQDGHLKAPLHPHFTFQGIESLLFGHRRPQEKLTDTEYGQPSALPCLGVDNICETSRGTTLNPFFRYSNDMTSVKLNKDYGDEAKQQSHHDWEAEHGAPDRGAQHHVHHG